MESILCTISNDFCLLLIYLARHELLLLSASLQPELAIADTFTISWPTEQQWAGGKKCNYHANAAQETCHIATNWAGSEYVAEEKCIFVSEGDIIYTLQRETWRYLFYKLILERSGFFSGLGLFSSKRQFLQKKTDDGIP